MYEELTARKSHTIMHFKAEFLLSNMLVRTAQNTYCSSDTKSIRSLELRTIWTSITFRGLNAEFEMLKQAVHNEPTGL
jgi:hypothetical protein